MKWYTVHLEMITDKSSKEVEKIKATLDIRHAGLREWFEHSRDEVDIFSGEVFLEPEAYEFLQSFRSYSWNTDHREHPFELVLFAPFEAWFLEGLCRFSDWKYERRYVMWKGEVSLDPLEIRHHTPGTLIVTTTVMLLLQGKVMRFLAFPFAKEMLPDLFRNGKVAVDMEYMSHFFPSAVSLKKSFDLELPEVVEVGEGKIEVDLREIQNGFFEMGFYLSFGGRRFPLMFEEMARVLAEKKRVVLRDKKGVVYVQEGSLFYERLSLVVRKTLESFSAFLREVKQNVVLTRDLEALFGHYLPALEEKLSFVEELGWKRGEIDRVEIKLAPGKMNWLDVDFHFEAGGEVLSEEQLARLREFGYILRGKEILSFPEEQRKWVDRVQGLWFLEYTGKGRHIHPAHMFAFHEVLRQAPSFRSFEVSLPQQYANFLQDGLALDQSVKIPEVLEGVMRGYQKLGFWWLHFLYRCNFGGFLADEMGLGKTLQMIAFILSLKGRGQILIVTPTALMHNWAREIEKFVGGELNFVVMEGSPEERRQKQEKSDDYDVLITSYTIVHQDREFYHGKRFHLCVLDESQHIKNKKAKRTQTIRLLQADHRVAITGTPIENSVGELWTVFDFLMPGFLGSYQWFVKNFQLPLQEGDPSLRSQVYEKLRQLIRPFVLRRTKDEVLTDLPPKIEQEVWLDLTEEQKTLYLATVENIRQVYERDYRNATQQAVSYFLAGLTRLRQICLHPELVGISCREEPIKMRALRELVLQALDSEHRVVVFSQFVELLSLVRRELESIGVEHLYLDGRTKRRVELVEDFNRGEMPVFLISTRAGGTGLTITGADTVILLDPWWNPSVEKQAIDRVHRLGQKRMVHVFRLFTEGTIEEKMFLLQKKKRDVFHALITSNTEFLTRLSWQDLADLLELERRKETSLPFC